MRTVLVDASCEYCATVTGMPSLRFWTMPAFNVMCAAPSPTMVCVRRVMTTELSCTGAWKLCGRGALSTELRSGRSRNRTQHTEAILTLPNRRVEISFLQKDPRLWAEWHECCKVCEYKLDSLAWSSSQLYPPFEKLQEENPNLRYYDIHTSLPISTV